MTVLKNLLNIYIHKLLELNILHLEKWHEYPLLLHYHIILERGLNREKRPEK